MIEEANFVVYRKEDIKKIPQDATVVHVGYKMSLQDIGEIIRTRKNVKALQFPPSIVDSLHPFVHTMLGMHGIKRLVGYADRYDWDLVEEARKLREQRRWGYEKIAQHISDKIRGDISAQTIWYWVNKRKEHV